MAAENSSKLLEREKLLQPMKYCGQWRRPWVNSEPGHSVLSWVRLCNSKCCVSSSDTTYRCTCSVLNLQTVVCKRAFKIFKEKSYSTSLLMFHENCSASVQIAWPHLIIYIYIFVCLYWKHIFLVHSWKYTIFKKLFFSQENKQKVLMTHLALQRFWSNQKPSKYAPPPPAGK